jgi:hypothetical protein
MGMNIFGSGLKKTNFIIISLIISICSTISQTPPKRHNNLRKLAIRADEKAGIKVDKDNPQARAKFEKMRTMDPAKGFVPENIREKELRYVHSKKAGLINKKKSGSSSIEWTHRGPYNVGGRTRALAVDISDENILLAGGVSGGMWRTTNRGKIWTKTTGSSHIHSVTAVAQDPNNTQIWYYTTGERIGNSASGQGGSSQYRGNGVYKSTDGGKTWKILESTQSTSPVSFDSFFNYCYNVVVNPVNGDVYVAAVGRIYRSTDQGASWDTVLGNDDFFYSEYTDIAVNKNGVLYATMSSYFESADQGIFRSTDGTNWTNITPINFPVNYLRVVLDIAPSNENVVYFLGQTPFSGFYNDVDNEWLSLWKYTYLLGDGADINGKWEDRSDNLPEYGGTVGNLYSQGSYNLVVKVKPDDENTLFIGGTNLYRSDNAFLTANKTYWIGGYSPANDVSFYINQHPDQHAIVFFPSDPKKMLVGHDGGISYTTNNMGDSPGYVPVAWTSLNNGYLTTQAYAIGIKEYSKFDNDILCGFQDNGTWFTGYMDPDDPWLEEYSGDGGHCAFAKAENGGTYRYVSSQEGNIYKFRYNKAGFYVDFTRVTPADPDPDNLLFINPFILDPNDDKIMYYAGGDRIYKNSNLTEIGLFSNQKTTVNWDDIYTSVIVSTLLKGRISALDISKNPANVLYYGTSLGYIFKLDDISKDYPQKTEISNGYGLPANAYVSSIYVDPSDADKVFVTFSSYSVPSVFYTTDGGASWTDLSGNLEENPDGTGSGPSVRSITKVYAGQGKYKYFVATSTGLYSTNKLNGQSTTWQKEGATKIGNVVIDMVKGREEGMIFVGTHGTGVYSGKLEVIENYQSTCFDNSELPGEWSVEALTDNGSCESSEIDIIHASENPTGFSASMCDYFIRFNAPACDAGDQVRMYLAPPLSTFGFKNTSMTFDWGKTNIAGNDKVIVQYSFDRQNWHDVKEFLRYDADSAYWQSQSVTLPEASDNKDSLYLAFLFVSDKSGNCFLDNINIKGQLIPTPPVLQQALTSSDGEKIILKFDKAMANPFAKESEFDISTDNGNGISEIKLSDSTYQNLEIKLSDKVMVGEGITLDYTKGSVLSRDAGELQSFTVHVNNQVSVTKDIENTIVIYPNPSFGSFEYHYISAKNGTITVNLINMQGQTVYTEKREKTNAFIKATIHYPVEEGGIYTLQVINGRKKVATTKVVLIDNN